MNKEKVSKVLGGKFVRKNGELSVKISLDLPFVIYFKETNSIVIYFLDYYLNYIIVVHGLLGGYLKLAAV